MPSGLAHFLIKLSESPNALADFKKDPQGIMDLAGLSSAEQAALLSGSTNVIRKALGTAADTKQPDMRPITISIPVTIVLPW